MPFHPYEDHSNLLWVVPFKHVNEGLSLEQRRVN